VGRGVRKADDGAVVVTLTVKGVGFTPMLAVLGVMVQVAARGAPEQEKLAVPVYPFPPSEATNW
jgi:hypothetical protein